jgi:hypothetical protein
MSDEHSTAFDVRAHNTGTRRARKIMYYTRLRTALHSSCSSNGDAYQPPPVKVQETFS